MKARPVPALRDSHLRGCSSFPPISPNPGSAILGDKKLTTTGLSYWRLRKVPVQSNHRDKLCLKESGFQYSIRELSGLMKQTFASFN